MLTQLFVLPLNALNNSTGHSSCYLPTAKVEDYNVMTEEKVFFDQPINHDIKTYEKIQKNIAAQRDDYTNGCLADYNYFDSNRF